MNQVQGVILCATAATAFVGGRGTVVATACSAQLVVVTMKVVHTSFSLDHQRL